jgi:predicted RNA-binding protein with PIN domain
MRAFLREAAQAAALMAAVVGVGLGAAQLKKARPSYPPAQVDPGQVDPTLPGHVDPTRVEMDESETSAGDPTREGAPQAEPGDAPAPPARLWLVDGFNVLHAGVLVGRDRASWWNEARREQLLAIVERFEAEREDAEIWVVFDGPSAAEPAAREGSRVHVAFARSADEWLVKRVRAAGGSVCVVTGDRQLADRARRRGAEVLSPRRFLARCGHVPA